MNIRIGHGYDLHRLVEQRPLIIGGVTIPFEKGLLGHSDADVLLHSITDAMLGALALGDIGTFFPDHDPKWKGADSRQLLGQVQSLIEERGWRIGNIDTVLIAEEPRLNPYIENIRLSVAQSLQIEMDQISVKATTNEGQDSIGNKLSIAAMATILIYKQ